MSRHAPYAFVNFIGRAYPVQVLYADVTGQVKQNGTKEIISGRATFLKWVSCTHIAVAHANSLTSTSSP